MTTPELYVLHPASVKAQKKQFHLFLYRPLPPIQCWKVTQQFPTKTIQFSTTLNEGGGERRNEDVKNASLPNSFVYDCSFVV